MMHPSYAHREIRKRSNQEPLGDPGGFCVSDSGLRPCGPFSSTSIHTDPPRTRRSSLCLSPASPRALANLSHPRPSTQTHPRTRLPSLRSSTAPRPHPCEPFSPRPSTTPPHPYPSSLVVFVPCIAPRPCEPFSSTSIHPHPRTRTRAPSAPTPTPTPLWNVPALRSRCNRSCLCGDICLSFHVLPMSTMPGSGGRDRMKGNQDRRRVPNGGGRCTRNKEGEACIGFMRLKSFVIS